MNYMSRRRYTLGPWAVAPGGVITTTNPEMGVRVARGLDLPQVAVVSGLYDVRPPEERAANERLIRAAPELLELLVAIAETDAVRNEDEDLDGEMRRLLQSVLTQPTETPSE